MSNIIDYLDWRGDLSLKMRDFNEVDAVILSRLSYIPFDNIVPKSFLTGVSIKSAAKDLLNDPGAIEKVYKISDLLMLKKISESPRFSRLSLCGYINQWDASSEKQFSALTVKISEDLYFISYRGTDNTLVGWKEDFNMSFICPVPAQQSAVAYIEAAARCLKGNLIPGGHSKGGNLAAYSAAFCNRDVQNRIEKVYNFDGPGFDEKVLESEGYREICGKIITFIPQSSIVGMLLEHEEKYTILKSVERNGLMQHDVYSWVVSRDRFERLKDVTDSSRFLDHTLKDWVKNMTPAQREAFVDTAYALISQTGAHTLRELNSNVAENARIVLSSLKGLDDDSREILFKSIGLFFKSLRSNLQILLN